MTSLQNPTNCKLGSELSYIDNFIQDQHAAYKIFLIKIKANDSVEHLLDTGFNDELLFIHARDGILSLMS